jgi:hypothetical protein
MILSSWKSSVICLFGFLVCTFFNFPETILPTSSFPWFQKSFQYFVFLLVKILEYFFLNPDGTRQHDTSSEFLYKLCHLWNFVVPSRFLRVFTVQMGASRIPPHENHFCLHQSYLTTFLCPWSTAMRCLVKQMPYTFIVSYA